MATNDNIKNISDFKSNKRIKILKWKISKKQIKNWCRLNPEVPKHEATDCTVNAVHFLGIIKKDLADNLSVYANKRKGLLNRVILDLLDNHYENEFNLRKHYDIIVVDINKLDIIKQLKQLLNNFDENEYTIGLFSYEQGKNAVGHAVVISKYNNKIIIFDPQQENAYYEDTNLLDLLLEFDKITLITSIKTSHLRDSKSGLIKKKQYDGHVTKKLRTSSPQTKLQKSRKKIIATSNRNKTARELVVNRLRMKPAMEIISSPPIQPSPTVLQKSRKKIIATSNRSKTARELVVNRLRMKPAMEIISSPPIQPSPTVLQKSRKKKQAPSNRNKTARESVVNRLRMRPKNNADAMEISSV